MIKLNIIDAFDMTIPFLFSYIQNRNIYMNVDANLLLIDNLLITLRIKIRRKMF